MYEKRLKSVHGLVKGQTLYWTGQNNTFTRGTIFTFLEEGYGAGESQGINCLRNGELDEGWYVKWFQTDKVEAPKINGRVIRD